MKQFPLHPTAEDFVQGVWKVPTIRPTLLGGRSSLSNDLAAWLVSQNEQLSIVSNEEYWQELKVCLQTPHCTCRWLIFACQHQIEKGVSLCRIFMQPLEARKSVHEFVFTHRAR